MGTRWALRTAQPAGQPLQCYQSGVSGIRDRLGGMTSDEQNAAGPSEETKRKFREALERKNKADKEREGESHLDGGSGAQGTHGPVDHKREFRRKSG